MNNKELKRALLNYGRHYSNCLSDKVDCWTDEFGNIMRAEDVMMQPARYTPIYYNCTCGWQGIKELIEEKSNSN